MARIRTIKPEFWTSEQLTECSPHARLLFIGIWSFSDDNGIHPASIARLKMEIFPADDFTRAQIAGMVEELVKVGLIRTYEVQGEQFWQVTGWHHQKIDQPTFKYPLPDGTFPANVRRRIAEQGSPTAQRTLAEPDSPNDQRTLDERSPPERKGEEGKGEEEAGLASGDAQPADLLGGNVTAHPATDRLVAIVLTAYHETLPNCAAVEVVNPKRAKRIHFANRLARQVCQQQGWVFDPKGFWESYFGECLEDPWLRGDLPNPRNARWKQNLHVLIEEDRFAEIMDRAIARMKAEAA